ncbi:hypothetical protein B484DRAFT_420377 [Ochromonadaceae sp. CCMP2298]|nr:hypothetical protein B484DRAFT_420377 [Ochromonadaceae sp. CCMP2298]
MLGHVAMVRTTGGLASAVNLTVHAKLCELQDTLQGRGGQGQGLVPIREELGRATSADNVRWRHTKARLTTVAQGLRNMPSLDAATLASLTTGPSPQNKKVLLEAARKLEREVLVPLDELVQATTFSYELLEETYNSQMEILEGTDEADDSVGAGAEGDGPGLRMGLCRLITHLQGEQTGLAQRVGRIQERFGGQREQAEALLAIAVGRRAKLSRAQHLYRQQLADWSRLVSQMREQEAALRQASRPALHTQTAQAQASPQSPQINQPGWGTPASKTKTVSTPGSASTPYRPYTPGAMGGVGTSVGRVRAPPLYSIVGQGSAGTGSVSVASPSASGSAQFRSPVKTPSSAAARFGQLYSGGRPTGTAGSMGTLGTAGSSAQGTPSGVSASASASATPLGVRSPLFSSYRSARSIHSTSTAASAASTGALTGASMGGSAGRGREAWGLQGAQGMQGVQAPLQLTVEDQSACTQLLLSQADLLQAAQEQLAALERRLASLKAQSSR